jgi:hypothetical protein
VSDPLSNKRRPSQRRLGTTELLKEIGMKNKAKVHVIGCALATMLAVVAAQAQTYPRVYVAPKTGNNGNNCDTATSPCQTLEGLTGAYSKVDTGGEIVFIESGSIAPGFTVGKSVSIVAPSGVEVGIVVTAAGDGMLVDAASSYVVLRGLTFLNTVTSSSTTYGIRVIAVGALQVENCSINNFNSDVSSHGIYVNIGTNSPLSIKDTTVRNNAIGIAVQSTSSTVWVTAALDRVRAENNTSGIWAKNNASLNVRDSVAAGNYSGFRATAGTTGRTGEVNLENCLTIGNTYGIHAGGTAGANANVRVSNTSVISNGTAFYKAAGGTNNIYTRALPSNNTVLGNTSLGGTLSTYNAQ